MESGSARRENSFESLQRLQRQYRSLAECETSAVTEDDKKAIRASLAVVQKEITRLSRQNLGDVPVPSSLPRPTPTPNQSRRSESSGISRLRRNSGSSPGHRRDPESIGISRSNVVIIPSELQPELLNRAWTLISTHISNLAKIRDGFVEYSRCVASMPGCARDLSDQISAFYEDSTHKDKENVQVFQTVMKSISVAVEHFQPRSSLDVEALGKIDSWTKELLELKKRIRTIDGIRKRRVNELPRINQEKIQEYRHSLQELKCDVRRALSSRYRRMDVCFTNLIQAQVGFFSSAYGSAGPLLRVLRSKQATMEDEATNDTQKWEEKFQIKSMKIPSLPRKRYRRIRAKGYSSGWVNSYSRRDSSIEESNEVKTTPRGGFRRMFSTGNIGSFGTPPQLKKRRTSWLSWLMNSKTTNIDDDDESSSSFDSPAPERNSDLKELSETVTAISMDHKDAINAACSLVQKTEKQLDQLKEKHYELSMRHKAALAEIKSLSRRLSRGSDLPPQSPKIPNTPVKQRFSPKDKATSFSRALSSPTIQSIPASAAVPTKEITGIPVPPPFPGIPPLPGISGIPGSIPPPPPFMAVQKNDDSILLAEMGLKLPKILKPSVKMKKLHWKIVRITRNVRRTVWAELACSPLFDDFGSFFTSAFQREDFERHFGHRKGIKMRSSRPRLSVSATKLLTKKLEVKLVEPKRRQNISIALKQFQKLSFEAIAKGLRQMNADIIPPEKLTLLQNIFPTREEASLIHSYTGDKKILGDIERFFLTMSDIGLRNRLDAWVFIQDFPTNVSILERQCQHFKTAAFLLMEDRTLKRILHTILQLGNFMNSSCVIGFRLDILTRLSGIKAKDRTTNFLRYVSHKFEFSTSKLEALVKGLSPAVRASSKALGNGLRAIKEAYKKHEMVMGIYEQEERKPNNTSDWPHFAKKNMQLARKKLSNISILFSTCDKSYVKLREMFDLVDPDFDTWEAIVSLFLEFFKDMVKDARKHKTASKKIFENEKKRKFRRKSLRRKSSTQRARGVEEEKTKQREDFERKKE